MERCPKCDGLLIIDQDRDSLTGKKCANCGNPGMKQKIEQPDGGDCKWRGRKCEEPQAPDSVYCINHRDKKKIWNQRDKKKFKATIKAINKKMNKRSHHKKKADPVNPTEIKPVTPVSHRQAVLAGLDITIAELEHKLYIMKEAKVILS